MVSLKVRPLPGLEKPMEVNDNSKYLFNWSFDQNLRPFIWTLFAVLNCNMTKTFWDVVLLPSPSAEDITRHQLC